MKKIFTRRELKKLNIDEGIQKIERGKNMMTRISKYKLTIHIFFELLG